MSKLTSAAIKQMIVDYIKTHPGCVLNLFDEADHHQINEVELHNPKVWKRYRKEVEKDRIYRAFAASGSKNISISDQVTAQIETDLTDSKIISLSIEG